MKRIAELGWPIVLCAALGACGDEPTPVAEGSRASGESAVPVPATERIVYSSLRAGNCSVQIGRASCRERV